MANPDIIAAIRSQLGIAEDNLARANMAFGRLQDFELDKPHGNSGQSRRAIFDGYKSEVIRWQKALEDSKS